MARPLKEGMDYFPHDTTATGDKKIEALRALYGNDGYAFYFIHLETIYQEPNFELDISDAETRQILSRKVGINEQKYEQILATAIKWKCFDVDEYEKRGVLTSNGIKKRASIVTEKRDRMRAKYQKGKTNISDAETREETRAETPQSKRKVKVKEKNIKDIYAQRFDQFWSAYPKKRSKGQAEKAWAKIKPDEQLHKAILLSLERAKTSADWTKEGGRYIPYPATWLNAKGWEDEYTTGKPQKQYSDEWGID